MRRLCKPIWTIQIDPGGRGVREGQNLPQKWPKFGFEALQKTLNGSRTPEMDSNQSGALGGTVKGPFQWIKSRLGR